MIDGLEADVVTLALAGRHRRDRQGRPRSTADWQTAPAEQLSALHLDHRLPRPQGQPEGHQGLGRSGQGRRPGHHAQPEDLRRRALELSRRLGLCRRRSSATTRPRTRTSSSDALQERAGARHRRPRLDDDLRPARHRRRADRLGERGLPRARGVRRRQVRDRRAVALDPGRAAGRGGRQAMSTPRARARWPRPISKFLYTPEAQKIIAKNYYRPSSPKSADPNDLAALPEDRARHDRRSAVRRLGQGAAEALRRRRHLRPDLQAEITD